MFFFFSTVAGNYVTVLLRHKVIPVLLEHSEFSSFVEFAYNVYTSKQLVQYV